MVIAALVCFTILLIAWLLAPDHPRAAAPVVAAPVVAAPVVEATPLPEAA
jgi:hypothetical protein